MKEHTKDIKWLINNEISPRLKAINERIEKYRFISGSYEDGVLETLGIILEKARNVDDEVKRINGGS